MTVNSLGKTEGSTLDTTKTTLSMVKESSKRMMAQNYKEFGKMVFRMVLVSTSPQMVRTRTAFGKKVGL